VLGTLLKLTLADFCILSKSLQPGLPEPDPDLQLLN
jgi:hypothetical protein